MESFIDSWILALTTTLRQCDAVWCPMVTVYKSQHHRGGLTRPVGDLLFDLPIFRKDLEHSFILRQSSFATRVVVIEQNNTQNVLRSVLRYRRWFISLPE